MATALISIEEYLKASFAPDCEYVRGVTKKRAVGEYDHAPGRKHFWLGFANTKLNGESVHSPSYASR